MHVEVRERGLRQVLEGDGELARLRVGFGRAGQLDVDVVAVGGEQQPVGVAGLRFTEVDEARDRPGSAELSTLTVPTFEVSGQCAGSRVPMLESASLQASLPSAALGLIETPTGSVTVVARICEGEGTLGLVGCGTWRSTLRPEAVSVSVVVGCA